ncbi:MAG: hypothetical protein ISS72_09855 [Candidatus Brocadiae bacterium]|nr:hypothetical protein [Candidatus Brocadiia bacterium]
MASKAYDTFEDQRKAGRKRLREGAQLIGDPPRGKQYRGGMYLLGYAVECALKSVIMGRLGAHTLAEAEGRYAARHKTEISLTRGHDLEALASIAETLGVTVGPDTELLRARSEAFRWKVDWRYMHYEPRQGESSAIHFRDQVTVYYDWLTSQLE